MLRTTEELGFVLQQQQQVFSLLNNIKSFPGNNEACYSKFNELFCFSAVKRSRRVKLTTYLILLSRLRIHGGNTKRHTHIFMELWYYSQGYLAIHLQMSAVQNVRPFCVVKME